MNEVWSKRRVLPFIFVIKQLIVLRQMTQYEKLLGIATNNSGYNYLLFIISRLLLIPPKSVFQSMSY